MSMIIDGRQIAKDLLEEVKAEIQKRDISPTLTVFVVGNDPVTEQFLGIKKKKAESVGIAVIERRFEKDVLEDYIIQEIETTDGAIIVQLPLPQQLDQERVLSAIPVGKDVDVLSPRSGEVYEKGDLSILPPTTGAIVEVLEREGVELDQKKIVVIGRGVLVGKPIATWLKNNGHDVTVIGRDTANMEEVLRAADVIITGAGSPGLVKPDMVKDGVVLIDAGTSEAGGKLVGDIDPVCAEKASVFTPVPGGIGPITVAVLLRNVVQYAR